MTTEATTTVTETIVGSRKVRGADQPVTVRVLREQSGRIVTWHVQTVCDGIPETSESFKRLSQARDFYAALAGTWA